MPGNSSANVLASHAAPVPVATRVNMLSLRVTSEIQPRTKNGHPHHSTTGVASTAWDQPYHTGPSQPDASSPGTISLIAITSTGRVRTQADDEPAAHVGKLRARPVVQ